MIGATIDSGCKQLTCVKVCWYTCIPRLINVPRIDRLPVPAGVTTHLPKGLDNIVRKSCSVSKQPKKKSSEHDKRHSSATISTKSDCLIAIEIHVHASEIVASNQKNLVAACSIVRRPKPCQHSYIFASRCINNTSCIRSIVPAQ